MTKVQLEACADVVLRMRSPLQEDTAHAALLRARLQGGGQIRLGIALERSLASKGITPRDLRRALGALIDAREARYVMQDGEVHVVLVPPTEAVGQ